MVNALAHSVLGARRAARPLLGGRSARAFYSTPTPLRDLRPCARRYVVGAAPRCRRRHTCARLRCGGMLGRLVCQWRLHVLRAATALGQAVRSHRRGGGSASVMRLLEQCAAEPARPVMPCRVPFTSTSPVRGSPARASGAAMERTTPVTAAVDLGTGNADAASLPPAADSMVTDDVGKRVAETPPDSSHVPKKARVAPRAEGSAAADPTSRRVL